jgi:hypothetical protein
MEAETFTTLIKDLAHWEFELTVSVVFMMIEGLFFWPIIRKLRKLHRHHQVDDKDIASLKARVEALENLLNRGTSPHRRGLTT